MLYPYQDKQALCVTPEDPEKETISKSALNIFAFQPLLYVAAIAPLFFSYAVFMMSAWIDKTEERFGQKRTTQELLSVFQFPPHAAWALSTIPFICLGLAALVAIYMKLRTRAEGDAIGGTTYAHFETFFPFTLLSFAIMSEMFAPGKLTLWNILTICFGSVLLWSLTFVAYIASFKFVKKPSRFQTWVNRCIMIPAFFLTAASAHVVLSGDRWATVFVAPMCVLLVLSTLLFAVELSAQAYKGREVPVWRYRASHMMSGAIFLMYLMHFFFTCPLLFK